MKRTTLALAGALILCGAGAGMAQPAPPGPPPAGERGMRMQRDPAQMTERRAQHLRDVLQLRADQEGALKAFLDAQRPPEGDRRGRRPGADGQALTTPQKLDRAKARMTEAQARFDTRAAAIRRFYGQLSPAQQKAFDALPMGGRMAMRRGGPGGHMGPDRH